MTTNQLFEAHTAALRRIDVLEADLTAARAEVKQLDDNLSRSQGRVGEVAQDLSDVRALASGRLAIIEQMRSERDAATAAYVLLMQAFDGKSADLAAARAEAQHLREALLHRCAVNKIEDQCPECLQIIAVLDDTTGTPATSAQEVSE